ncbi:MAG: LysM domain-containing protein, partial [Chloroflexota bacterium]
MNRQYPGTSGGSTSRGRGGCRRGLGLGAGFIALIACGMAACVLFLLLPNLYDPRGNAVPRVQIRVPSPGAQVRARDPQAVVVQAYEAQGIQRYELYVDGNLALYETPPAGAAELPSMTEMIWRPAELGTRVLVARVTDGSGRVGTSQSVVVEVFEPPADELVCAPVEVQQGDTWETIAARYGVSPDQVRDCNPGVSELPAPGGVVNAPIPRDQLPADFFGVDEPGDNAEAPPPEAPPVEPPQGAGEGPADEVADGGAGGDLPWDFGDGFGAPDPPTAPAQFSLELAGGCGVLARWSDNSTDETGFRLYRSSAGANFRAIRDLGPNDALAELIYVDTVPLGGHYEYYVASVNDGGESPGPIAGIDVPDADCAIQIPPIVMGATFTLQFEALELTTSEDFRSVYCFLSLARLETHSRIPRWEDSFLEHADAGWNIADWAAGEWRYVFLQDSTQPVPVEINCWGMRPPDETFDLGTWTASHPSEEWDGRDLFGDTGAFQIRYHIEGYEN